MACALATLLALAGCADPVREQQRDSLGPEAPGVAQGPLHRAGQPCLICHDDTTARAFAVAGTVHVDPDARVPLVDGLVTLLDARGQSYTAATNCAGNFFVLPEDFTPVYPLRVRVDLGDQGVAMESLVQRDGSCASCHGPTPGPRSAGPVYLSRLPLDPPPRSCP